MKKIALFLGLLLIGTSLMGQSTFRRGVIVGNGGDAVTIDSITTSNDTIYFYSGSTKLYITASGGITASDTADMLTNYILTSEVSGTYAPLASPDFTGTLNIAPRSTSSTTDEGDVYYDTEDDSLYLRVNSAWVALNREAGGAGDVTKVGTPTDYQVGVWTGDGTLEGTSNLVFIDETGTLYIYNDSTSDPNDFTTISGSGNYINMASEGGSVGMLSQSSNNTAADGFNFEHIRRGASSAAAPTDARIASIDWKIRATSSEDSAGYFVAKVDGAVADNNFDASLNWYVRDGTTEPQLAFSILSDTVKSELPFSTASSITIGDDVITEGDAELLKTITGTDVQTQIDLKADIANEAHTGNTTFEDIVTPKLSVGVAGGNMVELDSITADGSSNIYFYDGADTLNPYVPYSARSTDDPWLINDNHFYTFGGGSGLSGDSVLFAKDQKGFGAFYIEEDSVDVVTFRLVGLSAGDSITWNAYYGNYVTGVATDSLFTGPQATGVNQTTFTPNNITTIPEGNSIWIELQADQFTGYKPTLFVLQMNFNYIRD
jgi:hypothetical protein